MGAGNAAVLTYNLAQTLGWFSVLVLMTTNARIIFDQLPVRNWTFEKLFLRIAETNFHVTVYSLSACQAFATLEFAFAVLGLLPSSPITVALQLLARNVVLFPVLLVPEVQQQPSVLIFTIAWTLIEVIRFPWLLSKSGNGSPPFLLNFLRYALPLVLYPLGAVGEFW